MLNKLASFLKRHWLFWCFLAYSIFCWSWIFEIDLARLASSSSAGMMMQIVVLLVITLMCAAIYTKSLRCLIAGLKKCTNWSTPLKLVMWWAATEMFVAWAVCIIWYGDGARVDNILPFTSLSHFAIWTPLGYLSRFVGFYGLSGVVFMILVIAIKAELRKYLMPVLSVVAVATLLAWGLYKVPSGPKINAVVVSEHSSQDDAISVVQSKDGSLVVFPEFGFNGIKDGFISNKVKPRNPGETVYFVGSRFVNEQVKVRNQLVAGDTMNGYAYKINKSRLIPGGEYLPYATVALFKIMGADDVLEYFRISRQITPADGKPKQALLILGDIKVGAGICSSIIAPEDYRKLAKNGANIFTNSANLGIFGGSRVYGWQHQSMARFMAIANARTFLQSATSSPSLGFNDEGRRLLYKEDTGTTGLSVNLNNRRTIYSLLGEYLGAGGLIWMVVDFINSRRKNAKRILGGGGCSI